MRGCHTSIQRGQDVEINTEKHQHKYRERMKEEEQKKASPAMDGK